MKGVIFDMDGVLIDSEPHHFRIESLIFRENGIELSREEHEGFVGTSGRGMFELLKKRYGLKRTVDNLLKEERRRYLDVLKGGTIPLVPGIPELVSRLSDAGMLLAVASSAPMEQIDLVMNRATDGGMTFGHYFPVRVSGDEVERSKPDPAIFLKAAGLLGIEPQDCWVIEDSENGIRAGLAAGMRCIAYENHSSGLQDLSRAHLRISKMEGAAEAILRSI
jgi:beta-phosphoglucomutase-like phosphatase (HAD superfamily)